MKYKINYGNRVISLPRAAIDSMSRAGETDLKALLYLCAGESKVDEKKLAKLLSCTEADVRASVSFWRGAGIVDLCGDTEGDNASEDVAAKDEKPTEIKKNDGAADGEKVKRLRAVEELPRYSTDELATVLEGRAEAVALIDECQNIVGKVFNVKEIGVLVGLLDYLGLEPEYIMMLLTYCVSVGKKSLHYLEKTAFGLYDAGITTADQLSEELRRREAAEAVEGRIRAMFGIGDRAFTTKEKKFISAWVNDFGYSVEIIGKAYEITADATGKGSFAYANSIIERWNAAGLRTLDEIEASYEKGEAPKEGSFDTDSFFEAAVRRSLGEN